jgi:hypothetical protein
MALVLGLSIGFVAPAKAQRYGPPISSGSGSGTGTGMESGSGLGTTGTGMESGFGLGTTGTGFESSAITPFRPYRFIGPGGTAGRGAPAIPGIFDPGARDSTRFPGDILPPSDSILSGEGAPLDAKQISALYERAIARDRGLSQPGQRSMAFERIGRSAIFTSHFDEAHVALTEAGDAALQEPDPFVRDQRILDTIFTVLNIAESLVREGMSDEPQLGADAEKPKGRTLDERLTWLENAEGEWERAAFLTRRLGNVNFRTQTLYRVADSEASGSQMIANQLLRSSVSQSNLVSQSDRLSKEADKLLVLAANYARTIERPIWRDRGLVAVVSNAAASNQFKRGLQIARLVPQPETRTEALLRLAEAEARRNFNDEATLSYNEAARAVASIPQNDPRVILAGVLIDSLVSVGRFEDARASIIFYPDYSHQIIALGAIAQSQGARGQGDSARAWIAREAPAEYRSYLMRKVNDGVLATLDKNRSTELSNQGYRGRP